MMGYADLMSRRYRACQSANMHGSRWLLAVQRPIGGLPTAQCSFWQLAQSQLTWYQPYEIVLLLYVQPVCAMKLDQNLARSYEKQRGKDGCRCCC